MLCIVAMRFGIATIVVALPSWLNYEAEHAGINVSRVLQEALVNVLQLERNI